MTNRETGPFDDGSVTVSADMLDAYLQGKLPPEQQAEFETFIIDQPQLLEQAELGLLMQEGFRASESSAKVSRSRAAPQWRLAAAAAIVSIGVGSLFGYSIGSGDADRRGSIDGLLASQIVNMPITRSDTSRPIDVMVDEDAALIILRVPLADPESRAYEVAVSGDAGPVATKTRVRPDGGGVLTLAVSAASLAPGEYLITVDDAREIAPLSVRVIQTP